VGARILWRDAQGLEGSIDLGAGEIKIGRAMDCAIRTDDAMVSRHHARLYWGGQGYLLEDLGSANGVYFQEQKVQTHLLKHGDAVRCGSLWVRFVDLAMLGQPVAADHAAAAAAPAQPAPMMQHHGMGAVGAQGPTGHAMNAVGPQQLAALGAHPASAAIPAQVPMAGSGSAPMAAPAESEEEIRRLRRRIEQVQAELRILRGGKLGADKARRMEDLENEAAAAAEEKERMQARITQLEEQIAREGGSVKVQRAVEIRGKAAEIVTQLNDLLSSLRIEVMAAEGEFDQYSHTIPRASFELIRQSLKESAQHVDAARDLLRQLREVAG
jgi:hypothetical protein